MSRHEDVRPTASRYEMTRELLECLNRKRIRCTYGALAGVLGVTPRGVGRFLGERCQKASWVVRKKDGLPTGYRKDQMHPDVRHRRGGVIFDPDRLRHLCRKKGRQ